MIIVEASNPHAPGARALLEASHALMESLFPSEANHYLSLDALTTPNIRFFTARDGATTLATGALAIQDGYGEVKSMFTHPEARGKGAAAAILRQIEDEARANALPILRLETGTGLDAAHRLYARHGFTACDPFGDYGDSPYSLFMEKPLG
ncbi:GNAT family N-acetyltransferase [Marimonas lutisalis]|uniref:GNAT family N-acetyltransferase n=1 Tax=Marimonas lutisalis TaxID=2545756 RepID=UPI0010F91341|nr:GNAT family N-acetyltransferase [Marimonas lutisalis]